MMTTHTPMTSKTKTADVGVYGASGIAGTELVRLLAAHPHVTLRFCTARSQAGQKLNEVVPGAPPIQLMHPDEADPGSVDLVFLGLPHGSSAAQAEHSLNAGARVIDLSGDLRIRKPTTHHRVYGTPRSEALAGADPNWGRILAAAGNAGYPIALERVSLRIEDIPVLIGGSPCEASAEALQRGFRRPHVRVVLSLGTGTANARAFTSDITKNYVAINSEYPT